MKDSQKRTCCDISLIHQDEFHDFCRNGNPSSFIRNRKMPLKDLMFTMINRRGITLSLELRNYMKTAHPGMEISKPGYLKQRMKLNPLAFYELYRHHNRNFYAEPRILYLPRISSPCRGRLRDQYPYCEGDPGRIRDIQQERNKALGIHRAWMSV